MSFIPRYDEESLPMGDDNDFVLNIPEEEPDKDDPKVQMEALRAENAALKARPTPKFEETYQPPQQQHYQAPPQQQPQAPQFNDEQINQEFLLKPAETLRKFSLATYQVAEENFNKKLAPMQAALIKQNIQYFKQTSGMEPEVGKKFDAIIKKIPDSQLAQVQPEQIHDHLQNIRKVAIAEAFDDGYVPNSVRQSVPQYGGSRGSALPGMKQERIKPKDDVQREALRAAKEEWGWSDAQIAKEWKDGTFG